ncbi:MAG TPA: hypothetical protein VLX92_31065 [Kofleriaceae bacterium]|nr:hypothetical protein [Kofleriaceae bacterium]
MKPIKSVLVLAIMLAPALAGAQGYYGPGPAPYPGGFHHRMGRLAWGFSLGLGAMNDDGGKITCDNCDYSTATFEVDAHLGGFVTPRFALMAEFQGNGQTVHQTGYDTTEFSQGAAMLAGQFWLTPQLWIKGGIGFAHIDVQDDFNGTYQPVDNGLALMGAVGFELMSARFFALDLQGRLIEGSYDGVNDHVTSGTIGLGLNWY